MIGVITNHSFRKKASMKDDSAFYEFFEGGKGFLNLSKQAFGRSDCRKSSGFRFVW